MSYKAALHVLTTFTEQLVPSHKHITLLWIPSVSGTGSVSASVHYPNWGPHCHKGPQNSKLIPQTKFQPSKFKYATRDF